MMDRYFSGPEASSFSIEHVRTANGVLNDNFRESFDCVISYFNGFNDAVTIVERSGVSITIPPNSCRNNVDFVIRLTYHIPRSVNFDSNNLLSSRSEDTYELKMIAQAHAVQSAVDRYASGYDLSFDYVITKESIFKRGGSIYLYEKDLVISLHTGTRVPLHPFSHHGKLMKMIQEETNINSPNAFGIAMRIVDNNGIYGDRYININKIIYKIPARKNFELQDGVYFTSSASVNGDYDGCPPDAIIYPFDTADKLLNLHKSVEEAVTHGDEIKALEKELERNKLEYKRQENEFSLEKLSLEKEYLNKNMILKAKEAKLEEDRIDMENLRKREEQYRYIERMRMEDYYNSSSHKRKDTSEFIKFIPTVIATISTGLLAYSKFVK